MKTNLDKFFRTDKKQEIEGTWVEIVSGIRFKLARLGNPAYNAFIKNHVGPQKLKKQKLSEDVLLEIFESAHNEALVKTIVLDWEGLQDDKGKAIPYSEHACRTLLADPEMADLKKTLEELAGTRETFIKEFVEKAVEDVKNS